MNDTTRHFQGQQSKQNITTWTDEFTLGAIDLFLDGIVPKITFDC